MRIRALCASLAAVLLFSSFSCCRAACVYRCVATKEKRIALTFDDGPHYKYTDEILDILAKYGVRATFFVIGENAERYPEKVKRAVSEGHEVGNHTYSHPHLKDISVSELEKEIKKASDVICKITDAKPKLFRPPEGYCKDNVSLCAEEYGCCVILWSQDTKDWAHTPSEEISKKILDNVKCGDIILFHDFVTPDTPTPRALENVIPKLLERGFEFVTVSELIST